MAYNQNIPTASQRLKDSQPELLANFQAIKTLIDVNHVTFDATGQGKHKWVSFPNQATAPATLADELAIYSRTSTVTNQPELFFRRPSSGAQVAMTASGKAVTGWTNLPSGIVLKWGRINAGSGPTPYTVSLAIAGSPVFTAVYNIQITSTTTVTGSTQPTAPNGAMGYVQISTVSNTQFLLTSRDSPGTDIGYYWLAIGTA